MMLKLAVAKIGCIASSPLLDLLFDERAEREDIEVRSFSSGAKMDLKSSKSIFDSLKEYQPSLVLLVSPNASLKAPTNLRDNLLKSKIPVISISDAPSKKAWQQKDDDGKKVLVAKEGEGFIIIPSDPMIGARAEFLDPTEMVLFNSETLKVLSTCGVIRGIQTIIGNTIARIKRGDELDLPRITLTTERALEYSNFENPYAKAKAFAALSIAESVASITSQACFKVNEAESYILMVAAGHEMMRSAAVLADEARELEKGQDTIYRTPHGSDGRIKSKRGLLDKPK